MSNVTVIENRLTVSESRAIDKLPVQLQGIVVAKYSALIKDLSDPALEIQIKNMLVVSFTEMGLKVEDSKVITFLRETLMKDLRAPRYATLSFELVKMFVSKGIRGEYTTFNGQLNSINIRNIHHWINEGLKSESYKQALAEHKAIADKETNYQPTLSDKMFRSKEGIKHAFDQFKRNGELPFGAFAYYDILNEMLGVEFNGFKTLVTDLEARRRIFKEQKQIHTNQLLIEKRKQERKGNFSTANALMESITADFKDSNSLNNLIKAEYLRYYFNNLINEKQEITNLLR